MTRCLANKERMGQVLTCRCINGMTNIEIANELCVSEQTVKNYISDLLKRVGVQTVPQACFKFGQVVGTMKDAKEAVHV